ncbi:hypothetical protein BH711_23065 [Pseudomonas fluorescens]|nr:hypothetical protein BH711_23065 [Pseudomonas fluorescens]
MALPSHTPDRPQTVLQALGNNHGFVLVNSDESFALNNRVLTACALPETYKYALLLMWSLAFLYEMLGGHTYAAL